MYFVALYWLKYDSEQILNSTDSFTLAFLQQMEQIAEERKLKKTVWSKFYHSIFCESRVSRQIRSLLLLPLLLLLLISSIGCKKNWKCFSSPVGDSFLPPSGSDDRKEKKCLRSNLFDMISAQGTWYTNNKSERKTFFLLNVLFTPRCKSTKKAGVVTKYGSYFISLLLHDWEEHLFFQIIQISYHFSK